MLVIYSTLQVDEDEMGKGNIGDAISVRHISTPDRLFTRMFFVEQINNSRFAPNYPLSRQ